MLVLHRKNGESIRIGKDITVVVISAGRGNAKIGICAPKDTKVLRNELEERDDINPRRP
jgi:carbon storage regulator